MKTLFLAIIIAATLLVPIILVVRHLGKDENEKAQKLLRQEVDNRQRMMKVIESDLQKLRESSFRVEPKSFKDIDTGR